MTLQQQNGGIYEVNNAALATMAQTTTTSSLSSGSTSVGYYEPVVYYYTQPVYWNSYPVYVCTDKTKKAIEVLKALQAEKLLKCDSVPRFIELVEKISNLL